MATQLAIPGQPPRESTGTALRQRITTAVRLPSPAPTAAGFRAQESTTLDSVTAESVGDGRSTSHDLLSCSGLPCRRLPACGPTRA
jgi:hypothetical protein